MSLFQKKALFFVALLAFEEAEIPSLVSPRVWGDLLYASGSPLPTKSVTPSLVLCHSRASPALGFPLPQGHGVVSGEGKISVFFHEK